MSNPAYWKGPGGASSPLPWNPSRPSSVLPAKSSSTKQAMSTSRAPQIPQPKGYFTPQLPVPPVPQSTATPAPEEPPKICEICEESDNRPIWNCSYCDMYFCDGCWGKWKPHKPGRTGPDGLPHEKADPKIVKRLKDILTPPTDAVEQQSLHLEDEDTTWFGISRDLNNQPTFQDYGRYATIMANSATGVHRLRYPQLVSFIGQTGAGKSTLVKMLIDQQVRRRPSHEAAYFPSPVVGTTRNDNVPTSGDVHLYGDPRTYFSEYPLLYADCEGLEGGEAQPISAQYCGSGSVGKGSVGKDKQKRNPMHHDHRKRHRITKVARGTPRSIAWADSPETSKRQYAVTELYPRLLYTFSDVIVFVLRNPKTFESSVLSKLINWASDSMEKSLNQPTLPHAVIALNATDMEVDEQEWDPEHATQMLMSTVAGAINRDSDYRAKADYWIGRGKTVRTMGDLLECYYSSVTVVRIPIKGRYMKIDSQISKLHTVLLDKCNTSFRDKRRSRMLSNSEELKIYLEYAFDHFSQNLDTPFNFMDVALRLNPIPPDFGGNILKLAVAIKESKRISDPRKIFDELSAMVASCIWLDCARQSLKGPAEKILQKRYMDYCDTALDDFCAIFWPCTFSNKRGQRCVNVQDRHKKGHQNEKGQIIGAGDYQSNFTWESFVDEWERCLQQRLSNFQNQVHQQIAYNPATSELIASTNLHHSSVNAFYQRLGGATKFISHSTCFCCLRELAEHGLPCGHVLCTPCVKGFGTAKDGTKQVYSLMACPLHAVEPFAVPWDVAFKPPLAGVRVLSLDGGGMRGIVILEVLLSIERELGQQIPILDFFDLVVGTSTGGILALALGVKEWPVGDAVRLFKKVVDKAFTPKVYGGLKFGKRKYRTQPLEEALKEHFKNEPIFGGRRDTPGHARKVAVTAASETAEQAVIFANYNRTADDQAFYRLHRPDNPAHEFKLWEAARATSAAPTYFKPFISSQTKEGFIDGAVFHNNPIWIAKHESRLLWPDVEDHHPDILLSIGTGHNGADSEGFFNAIQSNRGRVHVRNMPAAPAPEERRRNIPALWAFPEVNSWLNVLFKRVDDFLDSEVTWQNFRREVVGNAPRVEAQRYARVNPQLKFRTPKMDEKKCIEKLHEHVIEQLQTSQMRFTIRRIAYRLVASSFYFDKSGPARQVDDHFDVQGTIRCRFPRGSANLRSLGLFLQRCQEHSFQPYFKIQEAQHPDRSQRIYLSRLIIRTMTETSYFDLGSIAIPVSQETAFIGIDLHLSDDNKRPGNAFHGFPISGFPRRLAEEEPLRRNRKSYPSMSICPSNLPLAPSSPSTSEPDLSPIAQKRESMRRKRTLRFSSTEINRPEVARSASNASNISIDAVVSPEGPDDVSNWVQRRQRAARAPPKPVPVVQDTPELFELYGSPVPELALDEDDEAFVQALERSEREFAELQATENEMTDEQLLERAIQLSLVDQ